MSERQKNKLLAVYLIYVTAGMRISDSLKRAVERIENKQVDSRPGTVPAFFCPDTCFDQEAISVEINGRLMFV